ncbi:hypothetical protein Btru_076142 [Bulinus truncatus]|nr:hypothetical protein Btru_076142 [Bulinus truncatus]
MLLNLFILYIATTVLTQAETPDVLTQEVIDAFLQAHNDARADVSLPPLVWDETLSDFSADWSSNCVFKHSDGDYGENIYSSSPKLDNVLVARSAVKSWNSEIVNVDDSKWTCFARSKKTCGHYSQIVWRDTQRVGCGITHCKSAKNFVVCNYDPSGNWMGETPY